MYKGVQSVLDNGPHNEEFEFATIVSVLIHVNHSQIIMEHRFHFSLY